ncbi:OmpW/AlkL family protein [Aliiroseovarius sp. PTFE2010]|uniref:OmpW/AlkL family protein n=1 Tax=Aliiroseovarius sp. PTFE2010 TaxID=3417190 RepID=UPI003CF1ED7E
MKHTDLVSKVPCAAHVMGIMVVGCFASPHTAVAESLYTKGDWLVGVNAAKAFTEESLDSISAGGAPIPGAGVDISDDTTLSFDVSYFLGSSVAINFFGGLPASANLTGAGSLAGTPVGETKYGPAILSLQYHFATKSSFSPYVGAGLGRILFLEEQGNAVADLDLNDAWAPALQVGMRYQVSENWLANADIRYTPFKTDLSGTLGGAPVKGSVSVDPTILNIGFAYRF